MFKDEEENKYQENRENGIFLTTRQLSGVVAIFLFLGIAIFISGYFWGQRKIVETISGHLKEESFNAQVATSMVSLYDSASSAANEEVAQEEKELEEQVGKDKKSDADVVFGDEVVEGKAKEVEALTDKKALDKKPEPDGKKYYAQLAGGTYKAMSQFNQRLKKRNIPPIIIKRRQGKAKSGKKIIWHQAVTDVFDSRREVEDLIERIKEKEKLNGVIILSV
ncbi:hypothetical protein HN446_04960 [bacterium]|jgi:hypothetical protein|nr:hypothetical protein [bacterium]